MEKKIYHVTEYGVLANEKGLQTQAIQRVLDLCKADGGVVVFDEGTYYTGSVYVYANTTIRLEKNVTIFGSDDVNDFILYPIPEGMEVHTDKEVLPDGLFGNGPRYRCAVFNAYGEDNITIEGAGDTSVIHGQDCYDEEGEEGFRGPHGVFFTNCRNIKAVNYKMSRFGNFHYHFDMCEDVLIDRITFEAGHDGIHLHMCDGVEVKNCLLHVGDDCIAGENIKNLHVANCDCSTACNAFRVGGEHIVIEDCHIWGPCVYPHRMTIVKGKDDYLPENEGRHNLCAVIAYSSTTNYPSDVPSDITIRNCRIENPKTLIEYGTHVYHMGKPLGTFLVEDTVITGITETSHLVGRESCMCNVIMKNVTYSFNEKSTDRDIVEAADEYISISVQ